MMKRGMILFAALCLALLLCAGASAESDGLFEYTVLEDGNAMITGYRGSETDLVIPETVGGHPVTGLGNSFDVHTAAVKDIRTITVPETMAVIEPGALQFAGYLTEIRTVGEHPALSFSDGALYNTREQSLLLYLQSNTAEHFDVPEGIREIGDDAFYRARLVSVSLPGSVERIGRECFYQCTQLSDVSLHEGLKTIDSDAFTNCDRLRRIRIPASVTDIAEGAFIDAHLKEFEVDPENPVFTVSDGALINTRDGVLVAFPHFSEAESCVIPEGVTRIGSFAFYRCHNLKEITFPDGLLEIGRGAFLSCNHLAAINLPDSVVLLEDNAFGGNSAASSLHLPAGLTEIKNNFDDLAVSGLEIPETVTVIERSFTSLPNLTEVTVPGSVKVIGSNSFAFCKRLAAVTIPSGTEEIRTSFAGCAKTLVIRVESGSAAEQYCREHQLNYELISE